MRNFFFAFLLLGLPLLAPAQCNPTDTLRTHFRAIDVLSVPEREVTTLCVGRQVRFEPVNRGTINLANLYYVAQPGVNVFPPGCSFRTPLANQLYTPTAAGPVTVSENYTTIPGMTGTVFFRNYLVKTHPSPAFAPVPCTNNVVSFNLTDTTYPYYFLQVNNLPEIRVLPGPNQVQNVPPGSTLTLIGRYGAGDPCEGRTSAMVRTLTTTRPALNRLTLNGPLPGPARFAFALAPDYIYTLLRDGQVVGPVSADSTSLTLPTAEAGNYTVQRQDVCGTTGSLATAVEVHTLDLSAVPTSGHNLLQFNYGGPAASFSIERDGTALATRPGTATSFDDPNITCGTIYKYRVTATTASGGESVNSTTVTAAPLPPPPQPGALASFDLTGRVELSGFLPAGFPAVPAGGTLRYSRTGGGPAPLTLPATRRLTLRLDPAAPEQLLAAPPCYTLTLTDTCGTTSSGTATCPAILGAAAADFNAAPDPTGLAATLTWRPYQSPDPAQPVTTLLLALDPDGMVLSRVDVSGNNTYFDANAPANRQILRYRLANSGGGLPAGAVSYSNVAQVVRHPTLGVPTAFTPNGDGLNDVLAIQGRFLNGFTFFVIDRNGQEVFRTTDPTKTWDGRINGHDPANGTYVWHFDQTDEAGQHRQRTGTVAIVQ